MDFEIGDVVQLKSGGPEMTVTAVNNNEVACAWFKELQPQWFEFNCGTVRKIGAPDLSG